MKKLKKILKNYCCFYSAKMFNKRFSNDSPEFGIIVHLYGDNVDQRKPATIVFDDFGRDYTAEEICFKVAKKLQIGWLGYPLFALAETVDDKLQWYPPNKIVKCLDKFSHNLIFRIRCVPSNGVELFSKETQKNVLNYYFHQLRHDFLRGELKYTTNDGEDLDSKLLGLSVYDKVRYGHENGMSCECLMKLSSKHFIPESYLKEHYKYIWDKKKLESNFRPHIEREFKKVENQPADHIKKNYIVALLGYCTSYGNEEFFFMKKTKEEKCVVVQPYDARHPGVIIKMSSSKDPMYYTKIEDIMDISIGATIHINRKTGAPIIISVDETEREEALSLVALLDAYHRLIEDYDHTLCKDVESQYVLNLRTLKCHGPVGKQWSKCRLKERNEIDKNCNYMLKMSQEFIGCFTLIYIDSKKNVKFHQIHTNKNDKYYLVGITSPPTATTATTTMATTSVKALATTTSAASSSPTDIFSNIDNCSNADNNHITSNGTTTTTLTASSTTSTFIADQNKTDDERRSTADLFDGSVDDVITDGNRNISFDSTASNHAGNNNLICISDNNNNDNCANDNCRNNINNNNNSTVEFDTIPQLISHYTPILKLKMNVKPVKPCDPKILLCRMEKDDVGDEPTDQKNAGGVNIVSCVTCNELIGEGRFTNVYKSKYKIGNVETDVVVKQVKPSSNKKVLQHFTSMVHQVIFWGHNSTISHVIAVCLNHPFSFITEYARLGNLREFLANYNRGLQQYQIMFIAEQVAQALYYLHKDMGQVHGNVNCKRILVFQMKNDKLPIVKLSDPGLYIMTNELAANHSINIQRIPWLAPECRDNLRLVTFDTDVYAYGTTIWEMYNGGEGPDEEEITKLRHSQSYILPQLEACPISVYDIMKLCWAPKSDKRITIQDLLRDIRCISQKDADHYLYNSYDGANAIVPIKAKAKTSRRKSNANSSHNKWMNGGGRIITMGMNHLSSGDSETPLIRPNLMSNSHSSDSELSNITVNLDDECCSSDNISEKDLTFDMKDRIGHGHYGEVYKGFYHKYDGTLQPVALKMLKRSMCLKYHKEFEEEYNIMKDLKHDNIVCVIGRCTTMKVSSQVLVLEYVEKGSLREYLQKNQAQLGVSILVKFGYEIACGMNFLAEKHIVHRDLASRNVLVTDDVHMKIGDFGLSRTLCPERDYYRSDENKELPAPWCAPEALEKRTFTEKTDVWSYGVTMWEIFSYGENPNMCEIKNLWVELHGGRRLEKPDICPKKVYDFIMRHCWDYSEKKRSNFRTILDKYRFMMTDYQIIE